MFIAFSGYGISRLALQAKRSDISKEEILAQMFGKKKTAHLTPSERVLFGTWLVSKLGGNFYRMFDERGYTHYAAGITPGAAAVYLRGYETERPIVAYLVVDGPPHASGHEALLAALPLSTDGYKRALEASKKRQQPVKGGKAVCIDEDDEDDERQPTLDETVRAFKVAIESFARSASVFCRNANVAGVQGEVLVKCVKEATEVVDKVIAGPSNPVDVACFEAPAASFAIAVNGDGTVAGACLIAVDPAKNDAADVTAQVLLLDGHVLGSQIAVAGNPDGTPVWAIKRGQPPAPPAPPHWTQRFT